MKTIVYAVLLCTFAAAQTPPAVKAGHPRIWVEPSRFEWLKTHKDSGDVKTCFTNLTNAYYGWWITDTALGTGLYLAGSDSSKWKADFRKSFVSQSVGITMALAQMKTDSLAWKRLRFTASQFSIFADTAQLTSMEHFQRETVLRELAEIGSILTDWSGDSLGTEVRSKLVRAHFKLTELFYQAYLISYSGGKVYVSSHNAQNNQSILRNIYSLYGDPLLTAEQQKKLDEWYGVIWDKWMNGFFKAYAYYRDDDGGWNWGAAYAKWGLETQFPLFDDVLFAAGYSLYTELPWVKSTINQFWHLYQPDNKTIHHGDGITAALADVSIYRHAAVFKDPMSVWLVQKYSSPKFITWTIPTYDMFLFRDFTAPKITEPAVPLNWFADKVGLSVSRTGWDSSASVLLFNCSNSKRASHEHRDNNSFILFHRAPLLIDAGFYDSYGSDHWKNYYVRSIAHNTLTVFDSSEQFHSDGALVSNDGGQIESPQMAVYEEIFKAANQRGKWFALSDGEGFSYSDADAALSYDSSKVKQFRRRILFEKPGNITILDRVILSGTAKQQREIRLLFHSVNRPEMGTQPEKVITADHIEQYAAKTAVIHNGGGEARISTLYPSDAKASVIGGAGYEFWVNGKNYPPAFIDSSVSTAGSWRIEISPAAVKDSMLFVHSIAVGDSGRISGSEGTLIQGGSGIGVDYGTSIHLFSADGGQKHDSLSAPVSGTSRSVTLFAADLIPYSPYEITSGNSKVSVSSDSAGFVKSSITVSAGSLTITPAGTAVNGAVQRDRPVHFAVNRRALKITVTSAESSPLLIQIVTPSGRIVKTAEGTFSAGVYEFSLDGTGNSGGRIASGVYICMIESGMVRMTRSFVLK